MSPAYRKLAGILSTTSAAPPDSAADALEVIARDAGQAPRTGLAHETARLMSAERRIPEDDLAGTEHRRV